MAWYQPISLYGTYYWGHCPVSTIQSSVLKWRHKYVNECWWDQEPRSVRTSKEVRTCKEFQTLIGGYPWPDTCAFASVMPLQYDIVETKCTMSFSFMIFKGLIGARRSLSQEWKFDPWWIAVLMSSFVTNWNQSETQWRYCSFALSHRYIYIYIYIYIQIKYWLLHCLTIRSIHFAPGCWDGWWNPYRYRAGLILGLRPANERRRYFVNIASVLSWQVTLFWQNILNLFIAYSQNCYEIPIVQLPVQHCIVNELPLG